MSAQVFRSLEEARNRFGPCALTIGNFDGVHIGHQALLAATASCASENNLVPAVLTFHPHPAAIVAPERMPQLICTLEQRLRLLESAGAERILVLPFTEEVARLSPGEFVRQFLLNALNAKAIFVGENFRFGHKQSGTPETLQALGEQYGFASRFLEPVRLRGEVISSSLIRRQLLSGNVSRAGGFLGHCFSIEGPVVPGRGIGAEQTVPTLNLHPVSGQIVPRGIYITETIDRENGRHWQSVTSVGTNPTFGETDLTIETFLLAPPFDGKTPKHIEVSFRRFLREEKLFPNAQALKAQILNDVSRAESYWRRILRYTD